MIPNIKDKDDFKSSRLLGRVWIVATNFGTGVVLFGFIGRYLNRKLDHDFDYMLAGVLLGIAWGFYETFKLAYVVLIKDESSNESGKKVSKEDNEKN